MCVQPTLNIVGLIQLSVSIDGGRTFLFHNIYTVSELSNIYLQIVNKPMIGSRHECLEHIISAEENCCKHDSSLLHVIGDITDIYIFFIIFI